jgi:hypothetical protein
MPRPFKPQHPTPYELGERKRRQERLDKEAAAKKRLEDIEEGGEPNPIGWYLKRRENQR